MMSIIVCLCLYVHVMHACMHVCMFTVTVVSVIQRVCITNNVVSNIGIVHLLCLIIILHVANCQL